MVLTVRIFSLPSKHFWQSKENHARKVEKYIESLLELVPHDYRFDAEIKHAIPTFDDFGLPCYLFLIVDVKEA